MHTQVAIIGAGPAGLLLGRLLRLNGIDSVILESHSRDYIENRVRAGVLEHQSVDILNEAGVGARLAREGLLHHGVILRFNGQTHRIDLEDLTGRGVTVYGQQEVVKDLVAARLEDGDPLLFEASDVSVHAFDTDKPEVRFKTAGESRTLHCDFIAGCDGFHGICRPSIPSGVLTAFERVYPFAWLGILADAPPSSDEIIYASHDDGFALLSMRSPSVSRLYLQCAPDEDLDAWPDARIWSELQKRLDSHAGFKLRTGVVQQKSMTPMRSFVVEPMQSGRLFLAGDAAHIVPPTGAKGMNLALADVYVLARALATRYRSTDLRQLAAYSATCLRRIWKVQRFSWWMTAMLHRFDDHNPFDRRRQLAELDYFTSSRAAEQTLAENYVGLPLEPPGD
jgi:p-hydroxybenzoate 3-monooxygenase